MINVNSAIHCDYNASISGFSHESALSLQTGQRLTIKSISAVKNFHPRGLGAGPQTPIASGAKNPDHIWLNVFMPYFLVSPTKEVLEMPLTDNG